DEVARELPLPAKDPSPRAPATAGRQVAGAAHPSPLSAGRQLLGAPMPASAGPQLAGPPEPSPAAVATPRLTFASYLFGREHRDVRRLRVGWRGIPVSILCRLG